MAVAGKWQGINDLFMTIFLARAFQNPNNLEIISQIQIYLSTSFLSQEEDKETWSYHDCRITID